ASYCLSHKTNLDEALRWIGQSIQGEEQFENVMTKAGILEAMNRGEEAKAAHDHAMQIGSATQIYLFGRQMQGEKRDALAMATFKTVHARFPNHWVGHLAQARVASSEGKFDEAANELRAALAGGLPDQSKSALEGYLKRVQAKQDFNR